MDFGGQRSRSQWTRREISCERFSGSSSKLSVMLSMVKRIDFGGHSSKVKVTMGIIDKCGVRGDATLCVVITPVVHRL